MLLAGRREKLTFLQMYGTIGHICKIPLDNSALQKWQQISRGDQRSAPAKLTLSDMAGNLGGCQQVRSPGSRKVLVRLSGVE
jgi:hypothetical protein